MPAEGQRSAWGRWVVLHRNGRAAVGATCRAPLGAPPRASPWGGKEVRCRQGTMKRSATGKPRNSSRHAIRVQLVDDQALVREGLARLVSAARGMQVVATAANIDDAIRRAVATSPDVVLLDLL